MGRSSSSCFKIIGCGGGDGAEEEDDDLEQDEVKTSSDKRRWSFRKRSSRHQVLSTTVISEPISICSSKQSQELPSLHSSKHSLIEKPKVQTKPIETSPLPSDIVNKEAPPLPDKSATPVEPVLNEPDTIVIQAAIRGYLAREKLHKLKSVVKLQAVIRGHLVRREAIGTLRCIQAIIRMQALIRARARQFQGKEIFLKKSNKTTIKLLSNGLARQLLETTPATKAIHIKCDPSKSDSTWKWLERWMAVTSSGATHELEESFNEDSLELEGDNKMTDTRLEGDNKMTDAKLEDDNRMTDTRLEGDNRMTDTRLEGDNRMTDTRSYSIPSVLSDAKLAPVELVMDDDDKNCLATEKINEFAFQTPVTAPLNNHESLLNNDVENLEVKDVPLNIKLEEYRDTVIINEDGQESISDDKILLTNPSADVPDVTVPDKCKCAEDTSNHSTEGASHETLESDEKKSAIGSRKPCNPAFVAAQSKFEELSSLSTVGRSASSANQNGAPKSKAKANNVHPESFANSTETVSADSSMFPDSRVQAAVSECGTEISISSTLDSLDKSEMEGGEIVLEIGAMEKQDYSISTNDEKSLDLLGLDGSINDTTLRSDIKEPQRPDGGEQSMAYSEASINLVQGDQNPLEPTTSDVQSNVEGTTEQARSPEGTPRSHATVPDLHGTPSSDISVGTKKSKKDSNMPTHRQRSHLVGKRSPSTPNNDWIGRSSTENLSKDSKTSKRRNSFAAAKADYVDQEPRLSSSNSLPGYMQATISARAKAHATASQKSSPDLLDNLPKKRHSLPIENGKQTSSPRMQRSASQTQQSAKINGGPSPQNSAERRWQR